MVESAFLPPPGARLIFKSQSRRLRTTPITRVAGMYEFVGGSSDLTIHVMRPNQGYCYVRLASDDPEYRNLLVEELALRNGTEGVVSDSIIELDGTSAPLNKRAKKVLFNRFPAIGKFCKRRPVVSLLEDVLSGPLLEKRDAGGDIEVDTTKVLTFSDINGVIELTVPRDANIMEV